MVRMSKVQIKINRKLAMKQRQRWPRVKLTQRMVVAGILTDLLVFDAAARIWTDLTAPIGPFLPLPRYKHGFASSSSELFVLGGQAADNTYGVCLSHTDSQTDR
jgi:hypothetical protein